MKKLFTLALLAVVAVAANAKVKKWDFTTWSQASAICAAEDWTKSENASKTYIEGDEIRWNLNEAQVDANGNVTAGGVPVAELQGLKFTLPAYGLGIAFNYQTTTDGNNWGPYHGGTYLWFTGNSTKFTIQNVVAGSTIKIGVESHKLSDARGFTLTAGDASESLTSKEFAEKTFTVPGESGTYDVTFTPTKGCHLYYIEADVKADAELKKWDFTTWSQASAICAAEDWSKNESDTKSYITGNEIRWNLNEAQLDANGNVVIGSVPVAELQGIKFTALPAYGLALAFNYQTTLDTNAWGPYNGASYLWVTGNNTKFTIQNVVAGSTIKIGVESHKPGDARGFTLAAGDASASLTSNEFAEKTFTVPGESGTYDVTFTPTKGCHLYYIEAYVAAEPVDPTPIDPTPGGDDDPGVNPEPQPQPETAIGFATWSLKDGGKIRPSKDILLSFPNADPAVFTSADEIEVAGTLTAVDGEPIDFDGLGGNFVDGIVIPLGDLEAEENTDYVLNISSVLVNGTDYAPKAGFTLNFSTRAAERKLNWEFVIDEASSTLIQSDIDLGDAAKYWTLTSGDDNGYQRAYTKARNYEPMMLPDETELPMAEQLLFKVGDSKVYVGNANNPAKDYNKAIVFNANDVIMVIPDCTPGDIIKFNAKYATKPSSSKRTYIKAIDGAALAVNGLESSSGLVDSLQVGSSYTDYKFTVQTEGDVAFYCSQMWLKTIEISEAKPIVDCKYVVNASYTDDEGTKVIKNVATEQVGKTNDAIVMPYSYWVTDDEGKLYTHGAKGTEFSEMFDLQSDTTFTINYKKLEPEGFVKVVYLTEAEDLEGTVLCTSANAAVRSSNKKAAYTESDITLCTLEPGDYKIKLVIFDAQRTATQVESFMVGTKQYDFTASATNFDEQESDVITVTTPTPVVWKGHEATENAGLDIVMIYAYDVLTGIENVNDVKVANGKMFNIAGQAVSNNFKGIVVVNGKKFVK